VRVDRGLRGPGRRVRKFGRTDFQGNPEPGACGIRLERGRVGESGERFERVCEQLPVVFSCPLGGRSGKGSGARRCLGSRLSRCRALQGRSPFECVLSAARAAQEEGWSGPVVAAASSVRGSRLGAGPRFPCKSRATEFTNPTPEASEKAAPGAAVGVDAEPAPTSATE
jgi:hypothetical protein